jgi:hypothetical protein
MVETYSLTYNVEKNIKLNILNAFCALQNSGLNLKLKTGTTVWKLYTNQSCKKLFSDHSSYIRDQLFILVEPLNLILTLTYL